MTTLTTMSRPASRLATPIRALRAGLVFLSLLCAGNAQALDPAVVTVPWLGNPNLPHQVYSGGELVLQGVVMDLDTGQAIDPCITSATWDSGAGPTYAATGNGYALEAKHTYTGSVNQPFTATLTVTLCDTTELSDTMAVVVRADNQEVRVNMAIDKGLWHLHKRMTRTTSDGLPSGYWNGSNPQTNYFPAATASTVQAFQINNHRESGDASEDPYVDDVARGLRLLLSQNHSYLQTTSVALQNGSDDPDGNGNGYGLGVNFNNHSAYSTGQLIDALVASGTPDKLAETGDTFVKDRKYIDIVQDLLDGYSHGMSDGTGGWWYQLESFGGNWNRNDTSASHWWAIGVLAAETWGLDAPDWVKTRQWTVGVPLMQRFTAYDQSINNCYFGYTNSQNSIWDSALNVTAAGLILMNADDIDPSHPRFVCAENYINNRFNSTVGNFYAMYQLTKAMRTAQGGSIDLLSGSREWYAAYADHLVANQNAAGAFTSTVGTASSYVTSDIASSWGLIMLAPSLFELPPQAVCNASPLIDGTAGIGGNVNFDGSQSAHPDSERTIVSYTWDFTDGSAEETGAMTSHSFDSVGIYDVVLTVEDDNGNRDTDVCQIDVRDNDIPPAARPGGPYEICLGDDLTLDGSASSDLDNDIVLYEWDWSSPINFDAVDSTDILPTVPGATYTMTGLYNIGLRVTDNDDIKPDGCVPGMNCGTKHTNEGFTTVNVIPADDPSCNQPPVAVCKDNTTVSADAACKVSLSADNGSYDPDGDPITLDQSPDSPFTGVQTTVVTLTVDDLQATDMCMMTLTVEDTTPPAVALNGGDETLECVLQSYNEQGATADDNCSSATPVASGSVDNTIPAVYPITYTATDDSSNVGTAVRNITVQDTIAPVIGLNAGPAVIECALSPYVEPGASATDACSSPPVTIMGGVNYLTPGPYAISYDSVDPSLNVAAQQTRVVTVVDTTDPVLTLEGGAIGLQCSVDPYVEPGASATDTCSDVDVAITGVVDNTTVGPYLRTYVATDEYGNDTSATRDVTVFDTLNPVITTCASPKTYVVEGNGLVVVPNLLGEIEAEDICDLQSVTQSPASGTFGPGVHALDYLATDGSNNTDACTTAITILERSEWGQEKVKVHFHGHNDGDSDSGSDSDSNSDSDSVSDGVPTPHCFTKLDLDGELFLRDAAMIPMDVRGPGELLVTARVVVTMADVLVSDESFQLEVKDDDDEKWEFKRDGSAPDDATKKLKIDWTDTSEYDSHSGGGLGDDVPQIETRFIGFNETEMKIEFKDVARPFTMTFSDGGTDHVITILDDDGTVDTAGSYDMNSKKDSLEITLPFRLTPATAISVSGGANLAYPVDTESNYVVAGAKYMLDFDRTPLSDAACVDLSLTAQSDPKLEVEIHLGEGVQGDGNPGEEVVGGISLGPDVTDWTKLDDKHWENKP